MPFPPPLCHPPPSPPLPPPTPLLLHPPPPPLFHLQPPIQRPSRSSHVYKTGQNRTKKNRGMEPEPEQEHVKKLKSLGISMGGKPEPVWVEEEDIKKPNKRSVEDVMSKFASSEDVIAIGDVFYADLGRDWVMQPGGPIAHQCKTLIEPSRVIRLTAQRFVQTFLGNNFVALHFRRHGFLKFCNVKTPSCFFPIPQAADCINRVVEKANAPVIYLSTDAAESETSLLQSLVVLNGKAVPLVRRPLRKSAEKWDALLYRHGLEGDSHVAVSLVTTIGVNKTLVLECYFAFLHGSGPSDQDLQITIPYRALDFCLLKFLVGEDLHIGRSLLSLVEAMLDKTICAMSSVFIGAPGSTFTEDILRLRKDWGSASTCDEYLCQGEEPNFIADNE
uniref:O-fucosyltransferase family protein n=1 Tax=Fagus sylvatica TaxID=28930 RepID=A0A2N9HG65_FAGSY